MNEPNLDQLNSEGSTMNAMCHVLVGWNMRNSRRGMNPYTGPKTLWQYEACSLSLNLVESMSSFCIHFTFRLNVLIKVLHQPAPFCFETNVHPTKGRCRLWWRNALVSQKFQPKGKVYLRQRLVWRTRRETQHYKKKIQNCLKFEFIGGQVSCQRVQFGGCPRDSTSGELPEQKQCRHVDNLVIC